MPWNPPPPVPRNRPFHVVSGSHISTLIEESDVGVSVAVTRQNAGSPVIVCGGVEFGTTKMPVVLSVADVIVVCSRPRDCRLVHGVAITGVLTIASEAKTAVAAPTKHSRCMCVLPDGCSIMEGTVNRLKRQSQRLGDDAPQHAASERVGIRRSGLGLAGACLRSNADRLSSDYVPSSSGARAPHWHASLEGSLPRCRSTLSADQS